MKPLSQKDYRAFSSALEVIYRTTGVDHYPNQVLSALSKLFPCNTICYNEVSLLNGNISWYMEPADALPSQRMRELFQKHLIDHPVFSYYTRTGDRRSLRISDFYSKKQFHNTGLYTEFYKQTDVEYQLGSIISVNPHQIIGFALDRDCMDFSDKECLCLDLLRPHLEQAYHNAQTLDLIKRGIETGRRKMVFINRSGEFQTITDEASRLMAGYFDSPVDKDSIPDILKNWMKQKRIHLGDDSDISSHSAPLVVRKENRRLVIHFIWGGKDADKDLLILEEQCTGVSSRLFKNSGLTHREIEILTLLSEGKTNIEIGTILSISPLTVKKHLENIYNKLDVHRRSSAVTHFFQLHNNL